MTNSNAASDKVEQPANAVFDLFLISLISLYYELLLIRWLGSEIRIFAYFKNLPLMACLFGLGVGMSLSRSNKDWRWWLPWGLLSLTLIIFVAEPFNMVHLTFLDPLEFYILGNSVSDFRMMTTVWQRLLYVVPALAVVIGVFYLIVVTFLSLGQKLGDSLEKFAALKGYSINIGASILGVLLFSLLSFISAKPFVWTTIGALFCLRFYHSKKQIAALVGTVALAYFFDLRGGVWSPYYRLDLSPLVIAADGKSPSVTYGNKVLVNHDGIEGAYNNSKEFLAKLTDQQRAKTLDFYDMIYEAFDVTPNSVLILAAGAGNDAAAAIRHGAKDIDCVEIDPQIVEFGRKIHPEKPYDNPAVHLHIDDARAFLQETKRQYDLVDFAYLDSSAAFSSMSSLRLDNYVYTKDSFRNALRLVKPGGHLAVTFYAIKFWQMVRVYKSLWEATGQQPIGIWSKNGNGLTFFVGPNINLARLESLGHKPFVQKDAELGLSMEGSSFDRVETTSDDWPYLFLRSRAIDVTYAAGLLLCLLLGYKLIANTLMTANEPFGKTMFCLGAAFMLIETKSIAQVGLLLGTTWITNSVVITAILVMILLANVVVTYAKPKRVDLLYLVTIVLLIATYFLPLSLFVGWPYLTKLLVGSGLLCLPLFFAALIFSSTFEKVSSPSTALGLNLLGALVGGVLEYTSLTIGISALNLVAASLYGLAALFWLKSIRKSGAPG